MMEPVMEPGMRLGMKPEIEPEGEGTKSIRRWTPKEFSKLLEIVGNLRSDQVDSKIGNIRGEFWCRVSDKMKLHGFDRQPAAVATKFSRYKGKLKLKCSEKTSSIWDVNDSDSSEEDDEEEEYNGEKAVGSENWPDNRHKDCAFIPWTAGNTWSEEEDTIAFECIKSQRDRERELKLEPITADQLWHMVSDRLLSRGFYRKYTNVCRYWTTKGREKHNLDARTPSAIEKASRETMQAPKIQLKQTPSKSTTSTNDPPSSILKSSAEKSLQPVSANSEPTLGNEQPLMVSPQQYTILKTQYSKFNHFDNLMMAELVKETGLNREQIKIWYRQQRAIDAKELEMQAKKEPSNPLFDKLQLGDVGLKRSASNICVQNKVEEKPAKKFRYSMGSGDLMGNKGASVDMRAQDEASDHRPTESGTTLTSQSGPPASTIQAQLQHPSPNSATQRDATDKQSELAILLAKEHESIQQKILANDEERKRLKLAIATHKERAEAELEAARAKEKELEVQEEIYMNAIKRITKVQNLLDD
ncbi:hypothetical protein EYC80_004877 [Monilinia laxa]|uniref:Homeobox domain-containing protein n=1 Tax=Monilinia laxa TaxID=61186 RepID=A0A5N6KID8_MONLA|nr:hypothetical protein EYC80_004877 [Monilinia laxa]